jgi:hypothetical protein
MTQKNGTDVLYRHLVMKTLTRGFSLRGASNGWGTDPANQIRGYRNEVRLHGLQGLQPAFCFCSRGFNRRSPNGRMRPSLSRRPAEVAFR